ncbi:hypothetical protein K9L97_00305 [Candidatus Woesearchaeota archaeon]|nr:hypothetical protein [Candidatus Woesearchaeota archaeon]
MLKNIVDKAWSFTKRHYKKAALPLVFIACTKSNEPNYLMKENPETVIFNDKPYQLWDVDNNGKTDIISYNEKGTSSFRGTQYVIRYDSSQIRNNPHKWVDANFTIVGGAKQLTDEDAPYLIRANLAAKEVKFNIGKVLGDK